MTTETTPEPKPTPDAEGELKHRRVEAVRARAKVAQERLDAARATHTSVDTAFCLWQEDRRLAASVLAGGISFRLFFWLLPFALILGGALGFASSDDATEAARTFGLTAAAASSIADAVSETGRGRWALLLVGTGALLWTSSWSVIALRRVHSLIWNVAPTKSGTNPVVGALAFSGVLVSMLAIPAGAARLREVSEAGGLLIQLLAVAAFFGVWLWASAQLPHGDAPLRALIPGAVLVAVSAQFVHLFSVLYVAVQLDRASELYGGLGIAATALFVLYVVGRVVVASAVLNAELWRRETRKAAAAAHPGEPPQG